MIVFVRYRIVKVSKYGLKSFDNRSYNPYIINLYCVMFMVIYNHLVKVNQWRRLKMSTKIINNHQFYTCGTIEFYIEFELQNY